MNSHSRMRPWQEREWPHANAKFRDAMPRLFTLQGQHRAAVFVGGLSPIVGWDPRKAGDLAGVELFDAARGACGRACVFLVSLKNFGAENLGDSFNTNPNLVTVNGIFSALMNCS